MNIGLFNRWGKHGEAVGEYKIRKPSFFRHLIMDSLDAIPPGHNMMALLEFDVTDSRKVFRTQKKNGKRISLFAFVVKSIATAIAENRELNSVRSGNRIIEFKDIDINLPIEMNTAGEKTPRQIVIRKADEKTVEEICEEINTAKNEYQATGETGQEDKWAVLLMRVLFFVPKFIRILVLKAFINNPYLVKKMSGTIFITSVTGMISNIPGFAVPYMGGPRAVSFALGSIVKKPAIVGKEILIREFLNMTIIFNHDIVDGAPAARFNNRLKKLIESADVL